MSEFATYPNNYLKSFTKGLEDSEFSILSKDSTNLIKESHVSSLDGNSV